MTSTSVPSEVLKYQHFWVTFLNANLQTRNTMLDLVKQEKELLGIDEEWRLCFNFRDDFNDKIIDKARGITNRIIDMATRHFAGQSQSLNIEAREYIEKFVEDNSRDTKFENRKFHTFNAVDIWVQLNEDFGNGVGENVGYRQDAEQLISQFRIKTDSEINTIGGFIVLEKNMWVDSIHKKYFKTNQYSHSCCDEIIKILNSFENFMNWADKPSPENAFYNMKQVFMRSRDVVSRQKFVICDDFHFITMLNKVEFRISHALGSQLQQFITEYGNLKNN